jgi:hypothetical protein
MVVFYLFCLKTNSIQKRTIECYIKLLYKSIYNYLILDLWNNINIMEKIKRREKLLKIMQNVKLKI